jgi:uncharacterized protein
MIPRIVVDTNVLVSALLSKSSKTTPSREVLRACALRKYQPMVSVALFSEYEDVLSRPKLVDVKRQKIVDQALDGFLSLCQEVRIFYRYRPNLPDEKDNFVIELALAGAAHYIVTYNTKDFKGELSFPNLSVVTPETLLRKRRNDG